MIAVILGLLAALANASQALVSKRLTVHYPARQLIGVLFLWNTLVMLPFAPFVPWHWSPEVVALHLVSGVLMVVTAVAIWDMFDRGAASSTTTASALSPVAAVLFAAILLPGTFGAAQAAAAVVVTVGVLWALSGAFGEVGRAWVLWRVLAAAAGHGLLVVVTRMQADLGVGVVETYVVRVALAAVATLILFPPRDVPLSSTPVLIGRSLLITLSFVLIILGVQQGSPVVVQTLVATTPLFVLAVESWRSRTRPPMRILGAALLVVVGVLLILAG
ncbi:MAG: EamA family transporter [Chloroflexi bacterium]|nr:EamA family transporter [Chloroflexota bacterium]